MFLKREQETFSNLIVFYFKNKLYQMNKDLKSKLALISLLVILGLFSIPLTIKTPFVLFSYLAIFIGSFAFGVLLGKK
jgi:hypothetical protein